MGEPPDPSWQVVSRHIRRKGEGALKCLNNMTEEGISRFSSRNITFLPILFLSSCFDVSLSAFAASLCPIPAPATLSSTVHASPLRTESSYFQIENTQSDILDRVFLIIWINAFNSCKIPPPCWFNIVEGTARNRGR